MTIDELKREMYPKITGDEKGKSGELGPLEEFTSSHKHAIEIAKKLERLIYDEDFDIAYEKWKDLGNGLKELAKIKRKLNERNKKDSDPDDANGPDLE